MAFILQESSYIQGAKPERTKLLGFIPWKRKSSAFGYAQALDGTWERYKKEAKKLSLTEGILMILLISSLGTII